ncbi:hypothetical protein BH23GEM9_BH23GEM9_07590 [soil metagenome]
MKQAIIVALIVTTACATRGETSHGESAAVAAAGEAPHAHHESPASHHGPELPATDGAGFTAADVRFMQAMIGHHAQALTMTDMVPARGAGSMVLRLAEKIDISQRDEIEMMSHWLTERNQAVPDAAHMHAMHMPGMVTPEQLAHLGATRGPAFDRLFLELMIQHHQGAVEMVDSLFASPGAAQDPDIFRFVTDVATDQRDEIDVMHHMLEILAATSGA